MNNPILKFIVVGFIVFIVFIACKPKLDNKQLIKNFITNCIVTDTEITESLLKTYLQISEEKKQIKTEIIEAFIKDYRKEFSTIENYKVYFFKEIDKAITSFQEILYPDKDQIYYVIAQNKVKMFFIIKNQKIISFFGNITILKGKPKAGTNTVKPFML